MSDAEVIHALASSQHARDPYLANVLATEALNRAERAQAALEHLPSGVVTLGRDGRVRFANPAAARILGAENLVGRDFHALVHRHEGGEDCALFTPGPGATDGALEDETLHREDGAPFPAVCTSAELLREGQRDGLVIAFRDATRSHEERAALRAAEERYQSLFDSLPDAVFSVGIDGTFVDVNSAGAALGGYSRDDLVGEPFTRFVAAEDVERIMGRFLAALGGERQEAEFSILHRAGHRILVRSIAVPLRQGGEIAGVHAIAHIVGKSSSAPESSTRT